MTEHGKTGGDEINSLKLDQFEDYKFRMAYSILW